MLEKNKLLLGLGGYTAVVLSKGFWLGGLSGWAFWLGDVVCFIVVPIVLVVTLRLPVLPAFTILDSPDKSSSSGRSDYGDGAPLVYVSVSVVVIFITWKIGYALGGYATVQLPGLLNPVLDYRTHVPADGISRSIVSIYFALTAGIVEEFFSRGIAKNVIERFTSSPLLYVLISSALFASYHWAGGLRNVVTSFAVGLALASLYLWTRKLLPLMVAHTVFDWTYFS